MSRFLVIPFVLVVAASASSPCLSPKAAMEAAEFETHGHAVHARTVPMNGTMGQWEVLVHMEGQEDGWKVFIDRDNGSVRKKVRIPNPPVKKAHVKQH